LVTSRFHADFITQRQCAKKNASMARVRVVLAGARWGLPLAGVSAFSKNQKNSTFCYSQRIENFPLF